MGTSHVEISDILFQYSMELSLVQDQYMIQAFAANTPQKPFTDGIGFRRANGRAQDLNAAR